MVMSERMKAADGDGAKVVRTALTSEDLRLYARATGQKLQPIELDYLQHIALSAIEGLEGVPPLKGGTSLQKAGIIDRFSVDFDFAEGKELGKGEEVKIKEIVGVMKERLGEYGFSSDAPRVSLSVENGHRVTLKIEGPQYHLHQKDEAKATIKSDWYYRGGLWLPPITPRVLPPYEGVPPYEISMMHPAEIAAEKVRSMLTRTKVQDTVKDLYDLWSLLTKGYNFDERLVGLKMAAVNEPPYFDRGRFEARLESQSHVWSIGIDKNTFYRTAELPSFEIVKEQTLELISARRA